MLLSDGLFLLQDFPISRISRFLFRIGSFREYYSIGVAVFKVFFCRFPVLSFVSKRFRGIGKTLRSCADRIQIPGDGGRRHPRRRGSGERENAKRILMKKFLVPGLERVCMKNPLFCRIVPVKECEPLLTDSRFWRIIYLGKLPLFSLGERNAIHGKIRDSHLRERREGKNGKWERKERR